MELPIEIVEQILQNLQFEQVIGFSNYVTKKFYNPEIHTWNWAAENGYLEVVKWLHVNHQKDCTYHAMDNAIINKHIKVAEWLHENRTEGCNKWFIANAIRGSTVECMRWIHKNVPWIREYTGNFYSSTIN